MRNWLFRYRYALWIVGCATVIDILVRVALGFDVGHIIPVEAAVFLVAAALLIRAAGKDKTESRSARRADLWLAVAFALGGLRLALWGAGLPVYISNVTILVLGAIIGVWVFVRRRPGQR